MARKYKGLIIGCTIGLLIAITLLLVGGHMAGWDIAAWFDWENSKYFQITTVAVASIFIIWLGFKTTNYIKRHMR